MHLKRRTKCRRASLPLHRMQGPTPVYRFGRRFHRFVAHHRVLLRAWYQIGVLCTMVMAVWMVYLLGHELLISMQLLVQPVGPMSAIHPGSNSAVGRHTALLLPGVTVPWSLLPGLLIAVAIAVAAHEAGHAIAAVVENVPVHEAGMTCLGYILPAAFVNVDVAALNNLNVKRRLRVMCAGVWHNVVLCVLCWAAWHGAHQAVQEGYVRTRGLVVRDVAPDSILHGHLQVNSLITGVGSCPVRKMDDWVDCLQDTSQDVHGFGHCLPLSVLRSAPLCWPSKEARNSEDGLPSIGCARADLCVVLTTPSAAAEAATAEPPVGWCLSTEAYLRLPRCSLDHGKQVYNASVLEAKAPGEEDSPTAMLCSARATCVEALFPTGMTLFDVHLTLPVERAAIGRLNPRHPAAGNFPGAHRGPGGLLYQSTPTAFETAYGSSRPTLRDTEQSGTALERTTRPVEHLQDDEEDPAASTRDNAPPEPAAARSPQDMSEARKRLTAPRKHHAHHGAETDRLTERKNGTRQPDHDNDGAADETAATAGGTANDALEGLSGEGASDDAPGNGWRVTDKTTGQHGDALRGSSASAARIRARRQHGVGTPHRTAEDDLQQGNGHKPGGNASDLPSRTRTDTRERHGAQAGHAQGGLRMLLQHPTRVGKQIALGTVAVRAAEGSGGTVLVAGHDVGLSGMDSIMLDHGSRRRRLSAVDSAAAASHGADEAVQQRVGGGGKADGVRGTLTGAAAEDVADDLQADDWKRAEQLDEAAGDLDPFEGTLEGVHDSDFVGYEEEGDAAENEPLGYETNGAQYHVGTQAVPHEPTGAGGRDARQPRMRREYVAPLTRAQLAARAAKQRQEQMLGLLKSQHQTTLLVTSSPATLSRGLTFDEWEPIYPDLPVILPSVLLGFVVLLGQVSLALALINALPLHGLDGHLILTALLSVPNTGATTSTGSLVEIAAPDPKLSHDDRSMSSNSTQSGAAGAAQLLGAQSGSLPWSPGADQLSVRVAHDAESPPQQSGNEHCKTRTHSNVQSANAHPMPSLGSGRARLTEAHMPPALRFRLRLQKTLSWGCMILGVMVVFLHVCRLCRVYVLAAAGKI